MKVPREIDELMWVVAEQDDPTTSEQFLERYPEFSDELDQRVKLVSTLRGSRPRRSPSQFVPRENVRRLGPSRLAVAGVAMLVLVSVTFATYATVQFVNSKRPAQEVVDKVQPEIIFTPPSFPVPTSTGGNYPDGIEPLGPNATDTPPVQQPSEPWDPYKGKVTIQSDSMSLADAIEQIAMSAGLDVTIAPGFEDKRIKISFVNQPAIDILTQMGQHFGFSPVKEGTVDILIIPVKQADADSAKPIGPGSVGSVSVTPSKSGTTAVGSTQTGGGN
jgi:hypothetical protein